MDRGFHHQQSSGLEQQAILFQSSPNEGQSEMMMIGDLHRMKRLGTGSMNYFGNSSTVSGSSGFTGIGNSCDSHVVDSVPESKHRAGLAAEWSVEEQYKLEEALVKYADESGMIKYVKIAATLRDKTVRDVAIRCRWMAGKRRKHEELNLWRKSKDKKDKLMESSSMPGISSISTINVAPLLVSMNHRVRGVGIHFEEADALKHQSTAAGQCLPFYADKEQSYCHLKRVREIFMKLFIAPQNGWVWSLCNWLKQIRIHLHILQHEMHAWTTAACITKRGSC
ncbi:hypothetical protein E3N88_40380 [Mikania micrantha]|uniref:Myb-like domain-containing protein n=1 Tax=Mikania micrantha TaxID=192012 RepID=A0A5N6LMG7_9ASTR|nr:hypothetical protein E3N88_44378 [Mikania micrantha]KAD2393403.1 hypothetical protein E3N88_40380 [Mikania micrantha]